MYDVTAPAVSFLTNHQTYLNSGMYQVVQISEETNLLEVYSSLLLVNSTLLAVREVSSTMWVRVAVLTLVTSSKSESMPRATRSTDHSPSLPTWFTMRQTTA